MINESDSSREEFYLETNSGEHQMAISQIITKSQTLPQEISFNFEEKRMFKSETKAFNWDGKNNAYQESSSDKYISREDIFQRIFAGLDNLTSMHAFISNQKREREEGEKESWLRQQAQLEVSINALREETNQKLKETQSSLTLLKLQKQASRNHHERKVLKTQEAKIGRKFIQGTIENKISSSNQHLFMKSNYSGLSNFESDEDCNVQDEEDAQEINFKQKNNEHSQSYQNLLSIQDVVESKVLQSLLQIKDQVKMQKERGYIKSEEDRGEEKMIIMIQRLKEDMAMAESKVKESMKIWQREMKNLSDQYQAKGARIVELESVASDAVRAKNEVEARMSKLEKEVGLINLGLDNYMTPNEKDDALAKDKGRFGKIKFVMEENRKLKEDLEKMIENVDASRADLMRMNSGNKAAVQSIPQLLTQQYKAAKDEYEHQLRKTGAQYEGQVSQLAEELQRTRQKVVALIDEKTSLSSELREVTIHKRELRNENEAKTKRIQELELDLQYAKNKSSHIVLQSESRAVAVSEVSARNEILTDSLEKLKSELFTLKTALAKAESEAFDFEKENMKMKTELKTIQRVRNGLTEEKEHLIQLLEMKNHILTQTSGLGSQWSLGQSSGSLDQKHIDYFQAIQRLSLFVLNRGGMGSDGNGDYLDPQSKQIVRGIFNENVCRLLDQYEEKVEYQRAQLTLAYKSLVEAQTELVEEKQLHLRDLQLLEEIAKGMRNASIGELPTELIILNEQVQQRAGVNSTEISNLKLKIESQQNLLGMNEAKLAAMTDDATLHGKNNSPLANHPELKQQVRANIERELQQQQRNQVEELRHQIDQYKMKLDLNDRESEELKRQVSQMKIKDKEVEKLSKQLSAMKELNKKIQGDMKKQRATLDQHLHSNSDLKVVVKKLDTELKKDKSVIAFLKQQLNNDASLIEGLIDGSSQGDEVDFDRKSRNMKSGIELSVTTDSIISSPLKRVANMMREESQTAHMFKSTDERKPSHSNQIVQDFEVTLFAAKKQTLPEEIGQDDMMAMLECQSVAMEEVIRQQKKKQKRRKRNNLLQGPDKSVQSKEFLDSDEQQFQEIERIDAAPFQQL